MEVDRFYVIYSTMTLATGSLIGLIGIFIIFRIQLQRNRIRAAYIDIHKLLNMQPEVSTWHELKTALKKTLETKEESEVKKGLNTKHESVKRSERILRYTINWGVFNLLFVGALFVIHVFILFFHNELLFLKTHRFGVEMTLFTLDVIMIVLLLQYLVVCILPKADEYLF